MKSRLGTMKWWALSQPTSSGSGNHLLSLYQLGECERVSVLIRICRTACRNRNIGRKQNIKVFHCFCTGDVATANLLNQDDVDYPGTMGNNSVSRTPPRVTMRPNICFKQQAEQPSLSLQVIAKQQLSLQAIKEEAAKRSRRRRTSPSDATICTEIVEKCTTSTIRSVIAVVNDVR